MARQSEHTNIHIIKKTENINNTTTFIEVIHTIEITTKLNFLSSFNDSVYASDNEIVRNE